MDAKQVGTKLAALCREGKNLEAVNTLYSESIVSVEAVGDETMPAVMNGIEAIRGKNQWWFENHEVHGSHVRGPFPHGDRFAMVYDYDITPKSGPMAGNRMKIEEVALYTVENGKIIHEEFFYDMG